MKSNVTGHFAALILAAGYSSRMGQFKPLLPVGEFTAVERSVKLFQAAGIRDIRVILGHRADEIKKTISNNEVSFLLNEQFTQGMFSSILMGVRSLDNDVAAFFLLPADIPAVKVETVLKIISAYQEHGVGIVYPCFNGVPGHPALISTRYISEILGWNQPGGLKTLLSCYENDSLLVEAKDPGILMDMDTPEDYQTIKSYLAARRNNNG